jgi:amino acid permease
MNTHSSARSVVYHFTLREYPPLTMTLLLMHLSVIWLQAKNVHQRMAAIIIYSLQFIFNTWLYTKQKEYRRLASSKHTLILDSSPLVRAERLLNRLPKRAIEISNHPLHLLP